MKALWKKGKKYVYTLLFGGADNGTNGDPENPDPGSGYDENGTPKAPSVAITFTPTVSEWVTTTVNVKQ